MPQLDSAHFPAPRPVYIRSLKDECPLYVFFTLFGCWGGGGGARGPGHNLLMQFSSLSTSKMEISGTFFFLIFDHPK